MQGFHKPSIYKKKIQGVKHNNVKPNKMRYAYMSLLKKRKPAFIGYMACQARAQSSPSTDSQTKTFCTASRLLLPSALGWYS